MLTEKELLNLRQDIEQAKTEIARLKGKLQHLMEQLEKDFKCSTIDEAQKKLLFIDKEIEMMNDKIKLQTKQLEEKYFDNAN